MRPVCFVLLVLVSATTWAKEIKNFNKLLMEDVRKDVHTDNDHDLKVRKAPTRGPASVAPVWNEPTPDQKLEKERQIGPNNW